MEHEHIEAKLNDELFEKLISMSADWEAETGTYGYRKNDRSDIEGNRIFSRNCKKPGN